MQGFSDKKVVRKQKSRIRAFIISSSYDDSYEVFSFACESPSYVFFFSYRLA